MLNFALPSLLVLAFICLIFFGFHKNTNRPAYKQIEFAGKVDSIYYYDKSFPVISINNKRLTLQVPTGCSEYLTKGNFHFKEEEYENY